MNKKITFKKNIGSNYLNTIITGLVTFSNSVIFARILGGDNYGVYTYSTWFTGIFASILGFGIAGTVTKFVPKYYFNDKEEEAVDVIVKLIKFQIISSSIFLAILVLSLPIWSKGITVEYSNKSMLLTISIITIIPTLINTILVNVIQAVQRFDIITKILIRVQVLSFIVNLVIVIISRNVIFIILGTMIITIIQMVYSFFEIKKILHIKITETNNKLNESGRIIRYSAYMYANTLWQQVVWARSEYFFLGIYSNSFELAIYGLGFSLCNMVGMLISPFMGVINNYYSELVSKKENDLLNKINYISTKYFTLILIGLFTYGLIFSDYVIKFVYSSEYGKVTGIFLILLFGFCFNQILSVSGSLTFLYDKQRFVIQLGVLSGIVNVLLDIVLIPRYGAIGAALSNTIAQIFYSVIHFIYVTILLKLKFPYKSLFIALVINIFTFMIINWASDTFISSFILSLIGILVYIVILWKINQIDIKEISTLLNLNKTEEHS